MNRMKAITQFYDFNFEKTKTYFQVPVLKTDVNASRNNK